MKKLLVAALLLAVNAFAQSGYQQQLDEGRVYRACLSKSIQITSGSAGVKHVDSVFVQFGNHSASAVLDTFALADGGSLTTAGFTAGRVPIYNKDMVIDFVLSNTGSLATDSLQVKIYAIDLDGNVLYNDYCWASFATPPAYSTSVATLAWTSLRRYRASFNGAFGKGTGGVLILLDVNDATSSHYGVMTLRVWL